MLPVESIKDKTIAAMRDGIKTLILSEANRKDTVELEDMTRRKLRFEFVKDVHEALEIALGKRPMQQAVSENRRQMDHQEIQDAKDTDFAGHDSMLKATDLTQSDLNAADLPDDNDDDDNFYAAALKFVEYTTGSNCDEMRLAFHITHFEDLSKT